MAQQQTFNVAVTAGTPRVFQYVGEFFILLSSSTLTVRFQDERGDYIGPLTVTQNTKIRPGLFKSIEIVSVASEQITFVAGFGDYSPPDPAAGGVSLFEYPSSNPTGRLVIGAGLNNDVGGSVDVPRQGLIITVQADGIGINAWPPQVGNDRGAHVGFVPDYDNTVNINDQSTPYMATIGQTLFIPSAERLRVYNWYNFPVHLDFREVQ